MVNGVDRLHAQFAKVPTLVTEEITKTIAKMCDEIVREIKALAPLPEIAAGVDWTWGNAPAGTLAIKTFKSKEYGVIAATIFVKPKTEKYPGGLPGLAGWFEFGTNERYRKVWASDIKTRKRYKVEGEKAGWTGKIEAKPYFWPVIRANKRLFAGRIRAAINRAMKKANKA